MDFTQRFLVVYSGLLTLVLGAIVLTGASAAGGGNATFDTIDVQRINVREPDGTLRMVVSNKDAFPGAIFGDREYDHPRHVAGMIFYNDEGMENGGLIFAGGLLEDGKPDSGGHLSFDPYDRDQTLALSQHEMDGVVRAGLQVNDTGSRSIEGVFREMQRISTLPEPEQEAAREALFAEHAAQGGALKQRVFVGKNRGQDSVVTLSGADGKPRLLLEVTPEGEARIAFLDADGEVAASITPESLRQ
ncbi:lactonase family protein [Cognatiluteimonas lumbrici]|uniref:lactonase family protein n=1 Tax=Cognatiluteimonas lumbrici TaxID=2559601 RepID=UPI00112D4996|nr:lactonase family protein [Luteimonas lumbrici]